MRIQLQAALAPAGGKSFKARCATACMIAGISFFGITPAVTSAHAQDDRMASWIPPHQMEAEGRRHASRRGAASAGSVTIWRPERSWCAPARRHHASRVI